MSDSTQQYVLKQRTFWKESDSIGFGYTADSLIISCPIDLREIFFQPLDISAIEKQLEEILQSTAHTYSEFRARWFAETDAQFRKANTNAFKAERDAIFEAGTNLLLVLFGLENTESEK